MFLPLGTKVSLALNQSFFSLKLKFHLLETVGFNALELSKATIN